MNENASQRNSRFDDIEPMPPLVSGDPGQRGGEPDIVWVVTHYRMFKAVFSTEARAEACRDRLLAEDRASFDPTSPWTGPTYEPPVIEVVEALLNHDPIVAAEP